MDWTKLLGGMGGGMGGGSGGGKTTSATSAVNMANQGGIGITGNDLVIIAAVFAGALALIGLVWIATKK